ncbi:hypothetical protein [Halovivax sp.]|uniref:hypothetical protein n=1 Tax=Halovivax sp. TaxID=1935978 RepID=UPI0025C5EA7C|nr:hypothetical protein [Halovivax sp.]
MDSSKRVVVAAIWIAVAALIAVTIDPGAIATTAGILRLFVVGLALFLAGVYLFDPWGVASRGPFERPEE